MSEIDDGRLYLLAATLEVVATRSGVTFASRAELRALVEAGLVEINGHSLALLIGSPWFARRAWLSVIDDETVMLDWEDYKVELDPPLPRVSSSWMVGDGRVRRVQSARAA